MGEGGEGVSDFLFLCASSALSASRVAAVTVEIWSLGLLGMRVGVRTYIHNLGPRRGRELLGMTGAYEPHEGHRESELRANQDARSKKPELGW